MNTRTTTSIPHVLYLAGALMFSPGACQALELLVNPGFESALGAGNWVTFSDPSPSSPDVTRVWPHTGYDQPSGPKEGTYSICVGMSGGNVNDGCGVYQQFSAQSGQQFTFSGYGQYTTGAGLQDGYYALLRIVFTDSGGAQVGRKDSDVQLAFNDGQADKWIGMTVTESAPANAQNVRFYALMVQGGDPNNYSAAWFDSMSASMIPVPEPAVAWAIALGVIGVAAWAQYRRKC